MNIPQQVRAEAIKAAASSVWFFQDKTVDQTIQRAIRFEEYIKTGK